MRGLLFLIQLIAAGILVVQGVSAQTPVEEPQETWVFKEIWSSAAPTWSSPVYGDTAEAACRAAYNVGPAYIYYKGVFYKGHRPAASGAPGTEVTCVSQCLDANGICTVSGVPAGDASWSASLVCIKENRGTGELIRQNFGRCPCDGGCPAGGDGGTGQTVQIGNPVDLPALAKVVHERDWTAPNEARFAIERLYRSDSLAVRRFGDTTSSQADLFGGVWQLQHNDTLAVTSSNPYDPQDTRTWRVFGTANGGTVYFLSSNVSQKLGGGYGFTFRGAGFSNYIDNGRGMAREFSVSNTVSKGVSWADGYRIVLSRDSWTNRLLKMTDNRGNVADFVYSQNVVPGSDRSLVSEITLSRLVSGSPAAFGKLVYTYGTLSYGTNSFTTTVPQRPVIVAVDYVDLATSVSTPVRRYTYDTKANEPEPAWPPLITSVSDGSVDINGASVPFATYTYRHYGLSQRGARTAWGVSSTRHAGDAVPTSYDVSEGNRYEVQTALGGETTYDFDQGAFSLQLGAVETAARPDAYATQTTQTYDAVGLLAQRIERNGTRTTYTRDSRNLILTKTEDADGPSPRVTSYTWHATLRLPLTRVTAGLTEGFTYDSTGLLLTYSQTDTKAGSPTNGQVRTWTYTYTTLTGGLKVLSSVNGPGLTTEGVTDVTTYTYTSTGELATVTDPNGLVTTVIARNTFAQPTIVEGPDKNRWTFTYDYKGRVASAGIAGPGETPLSSSFTYNLSDQIASLTNTRGKTWTFNYNAARWLTATTSPSGDVTAYTYDSAGNVTRVENRNGAGPVTFFEDTQFDQLGRMLRTIGAMGQQWTYNHDREDNLSVVTDPLSLTTSNTYDGLNRLISTIDRGGFTTGMAYDAQDRMTDYTDPRSIETDFVYNGFGEVVSEISADRGTIGMTYNRRGLVASRTDARGITVSYTYDNGGRLTLIDYPVGSTEDIAFTWDQPFAGAVADANKGRVGRINDGVIRMEFAHLLSATGPRVTMNAFYPGSRSYSVVEEADFEGNGTRIVYPSGREVLMDYDDDNRVSRIRLKDGTTFTTLLDQITYAPNGPMASALYGDGYLQTRTYDASYRLTRVTDTKSGSPTLRDLTYGYEGRDNLSSITDALIPANSETYGYTAREHLASASGPWGAYGHTYDGVGNRVTHSFAAGTDSYIYPATSNRLSGINLATGGARGFTYDASGNVTAEARAGGAYEYTYDAAGRMREFRAGGVLQAQYRYDAMGRQAVRTLVPSGLTIHSVFDSEGRRIAEYNQATGALIREYVWMGWEPIAVIEGGVIYLIRADHIGRPAFATTLSGTKVWSATYLPFGGVHVTTGAPIDARFPGQWFQAETGLHQNWMRDYDPTTGRYLQADPLGLVDGASVYGYALQNPGKYTDPTGEFIPIAVGIAVGAGLDLLLQLSTNDWRLDCVNWAEVGFAGAVGAFGGGFASGYLKGLANIHKYKRWSSASRKFKDAYGLPRNGAHTTHHGIVYADGVRKTSTLKNHFMNLRNLPTATAARIHGNYKGLPKYTPVGRWLYGTPEWLLGAEASIYSGALSEWWDGEACDCVDYRFQ